MVYPVSRLSHSQLANAALAGDPHLDPAPRWVPLIRPGHPEHLVVWDSSSPAFDPTESRGLRRWAAGKAVRIAAPALDLLAEQDWLHSLNLDARAWVIAVTRDKPIGMARLLRELRDADFPLQAFFEAVVIPQRKAAAIIAVHRAMSAVK